MTNQQHTADFRSKQHGPFQLISRSCFARIFFGIGVALGSAAAVAQSIPPQPTVSATDNGLVSQDSSINGRDGAWSAQINNRSMWTFSDTTLNSANEEGSTLISNSRSWQVDTGTGALPIGNLDGTPTQSWNWTDTDDDLTESFPFSTAQLTFNSTNKKSGGCTGGFPCGYSWAIWSAPIITAPTGSAYEGYMFYKLLNRNGGAGVKDLVGVGIATLKNNNVTMQTLSSGTYTQLMWQQDTAIPTSDNDSYRAYYCGALTSGSTLYMMSCDTIVTGTNTHAYYIAKVPLANVLTLSDWSYWNGTTWTSTVPSPTSTAGLLFDGSPNGAEIIYLSKLGIYFTAYNVGGSNQLVYRVAYNPQGPWSGEYNLIVGETPICPTSGDENDYDVQPHQEFETTTSTTTTEYYSYIQANGGSDPANCTNGRNIRTLKLVFNN